MWEEEIMAENGGITVADHPIPETTTTPPRGGRSTTNSGVPKGVLSYRSMLTSQAIAESAKNKLCKNVQIHGYCRYEGKGCAFRHDRVLALLTNSIF